MMEVAVKLNPNCRVSVGTGVDHVVIDRWNCNRGWRPASLRVAAC